MYETHQNDPLRTAAEARLGAFDCGKPSDLALNPSGLWCHGCEVERRERITASMAAITKSFEQHDPGDCRERIERGLM